MQRDAFENFNPEDFLQLAKELENNLANLEVNESSIYRTIFGRIYYAIFLYVREWLCENTEYKSNPQGEHKRMPNFIRSKGPFNNVLNNERCSDIKTLKKLRHQSDYYLHIPDEGTEEYNQWIFEDTLFAFCLADKIINSFKNL